MNYKIEKNIPVPKKRTGGVVKYPFSEMKVGDSFLADKNYSRKLMARYSNAARNYARQSKENNHFKFTIRKTEEGIRIWRIK